MARIELSEEEHLMAAVAGVFRRVRSVALGKKDNAGHDGKDVWTNEIEGCCAEMAAAKCLGVYWSGQMGEKARDILGFEVRSTTHENGRLIVRRNDPDDVPFLLVVGQLGKYDAIGWIYSKDAKRDEWLADPNNRFNGDRSKMSYFVPQAALNKTRPPK